MISDFTPTIRTVLADDEEPARYRLRQMLDSLGGIVIVGECSNGDEAIEVISKLNPDLVFLDIQMPGRTGIEVAAALTPPRPHLVFCTAYDRYAVEAFEQHAVDYLLKPVSRKRLSNSVDRVRESFVRDNDLVADLKRAEETQARLFPQELPKLKTLKYLGYCRPARGVGGDYYDFLYVSENRLGIALADVSGKGMAAALLMAGLQSRVQIQAPLYPFHPENLIGELNRWLCSSTDSGRYATFFFGLYEDRSRRFSFVNAGHIPPLLFRKGGRDNMMIESLRVGGPVVGVLPAAHYQRGKVTLQQGDLLVVFTDGVTEAMNSMEEEFGDRRFSDVVWNNLDQPLPKLRDAILEAVSQHMGGVEYHDDLTFILARGN